MRVCEVKRSLAFDTGKEALLVRLDPPVIGQDFGYGEDLETFVLAARHEGATLDPVNEFPCFVFIAIPQNGAQSLSTPIRSEDLQIIAWGELYRTADDAENHRFD